MIGCHAEIVTSQWRVAPMSEESVAITVARAILQPARRAATNQVAHDEPEIEAASMNQQALEDIGVAAQMRAAHPTGVIEMREGAFDPLTPLTHQAPAARSTNPPPDWHTPGSGRRAPLTNRGDHGLAPRHKSGGLRPPARS